ncbi:aminotransferase [Rhodobacteraceae bacterium Araon29]
MSPRTTSSLNPYSGRTKFTAPAPIKKVNDWLNGIKFSTDFPLIDVSQAAPSEPPALSLREALAEYVLTNPNAHLYGQILGTDELRSALAKHWSKAYSCSVAAQNIAITSGCNQAFCAVISAIAEQGDEIILPAPWYFNHKMWLDMNGVVTRPLMTKGDLLPDPQEAAAMITRKTKAIVLVTPNNPAGIEYPDALLNEFYELAKTRKIALILDETYKDFRNQIGPPHFLLADPDWQKTLIQLYSFSKSYRLTGHRVGAVIGATELLAEVEKFLDSVTICPSQVGQYAALWGLDNLSEWVSEQRQVLLERQAFIRNSFDLLSDNGWKLLGCGAYFAYVQHPFALPSLDIAKKLVEQSAVLALPGEMFAPSEMQSSKQHLRLAFANVDTQKLKILLERLENFRFQLAP